MTATYDLPTWQLDHRATETSEQASLDLTRHLPRRLAVGHVVIVSERPEVQLSVVRKRWMKIVQEVNRQFASTLNAQKKNSLQKELEHMQQCRFTLKPFSQEPAADCYFADPAHLVEHLPPSYRTIYLTNWLPLDQLRHAISNLVASGLIVGYGGWPADHEAILTELFTERLQRYGIGPYPAVQ
jgi:hypothetical protein